MDGLPDLLFVGIEGVERLDVGPNADMSLQSVTLSDGAKETLFEADQQAGVDTKDLVLAVLDVEGDGVDELLVVGRTTALWRLTGPSEVGKSSVPLPALRTREINDAAVGDLNRDGRPDVYLAIGTAYPERLNLRGQPDIVLMNRGEGRFEAIEVTPARHSVTNGITLADIDGDGWLDAVESVDTSTIAGPSRLLFNRTDTGDNAPQFVASEHRWDPGTDGMGAAIGDLDQDGALDLYNTSIGLDLLAYGQGQGRFTDETTARGILHEWSSLGPRIQWSPTFADLNLDGRLDIVVRHGVTESLSSSTATYSWASDLIYTQGADGRFSRVAAPSEQDAGGGRNFALGDIDFDGRPDLARDGEIDETLLWHNTTALAEDAPRLSLHLAGTVSGSPPTGAWVEGQCGDKSLTRHLTSGGKMGANRANALFFAWPECDETSLTLRVHWPSGALSETSVASNLRSTRIEEPRWSELKDDGSLLLDPSETGANQACAKDTEGLWTCCDAPCVIESTTPRPVSVKLDEEVEVSLPAVTDQWLWVTSPALAQPGEDLTIQVLHVGTDSSFDGTSVALYVDDEAVMWTDVDTETRILTASVEVSSERDAFTLTLRRGEQTLTEQSLPVGFLLNAQAPWFELYPTRPLPPLDETSAWQVHLHTPPGVYAPEWISKLSLWRADGSAIPIANRSTDGAMRRVSLEVDWANLEGVEGVWLRDRDDGPSIALAVASPNDSQEELAVIEGLACGLQRSRFRSGGHDAAGVIVTAFGPGGHPMLLTPGELKVEVDGGQATSDVITFPGMMDMFFRVQSDDSEGPGVVTVSDSAGSHSATCQFNVSEWPEESVSIEDSWATLSATTLGTWSFDTARLRIGLKNEFGELMGAKAWPQVLISGGEWARDLVVTDAGTLTGDIRATGESDTILITITLAAQVFQTFEITVTGGGRGEPSEPSPPTETTDDDGCGGGRPSGPWPSLPMTLLVLGAAWRLRRQSLPRQGAEVA